MEERFPSDEEQMQRMSDEIEQGWGSTVESLRQATLDILPMMTAEEIDGLYDTFWETYEQVLVKYKAHSTNLRNEIYVQSEKILERQAQRNHIKGFFKSALNHLRYGRTES